MVDAITTWGSHQFLDEFALAYHRAVAERLRVMPELIIKHARNNLARWSTQSGFSFGTALSLQEWEEVLEESSVEQLISLITEDSDEGQRRRQSTPFAGVLTAEERMELLTACEKRSSARLKSPGE